MSRLLYLIWVIENLTFLKEVSELNLAAAVQSLKTLIYPSPQAVAGVDLPSDGDLAQGNR